MQGGFEPAFSGLLLPAPTRNAQCGGSESNSARRAVHFAAPRVGLPGPGSAPCAVGTATTAPTSIQAGSGESADNTLLSKEIAAVEPAPRPTSDGSGGASVSVPPPTTTQSHLATPSSPNHGGRVPTSFADNTTYSTEYTPKTAAQPIVPAPAALCGDEAACEQDAPSVSTYTREYVAKELPRMQQAAPRQHVLKHPHPGTSFSAGTTYASTLGLGWREEALPGVDVQDHSDPGIAVTCSLTSEATASCFGGSKRLPQARDCRAGASGETCSGRPGLGPVSTQYKDEYTAKTAPVAAAVGEKAAERVPVNDARWDASSQYKSDYVERQADAVPSGACGVRTAGPRVIAAGTTPSGAAGLMHTGPATEYAVSYQAHTFEAKDSALDREAVGRYQANSAQWAASTQYADDYRQHAPGPQRPTYRPKQRSIVMATNASRGLDVVPGRAKFQGQSAYADDFPVRPAPILRHAPVAAPSGRCHPPATFDGTTTYATEFRGEANASAVEPDQLHWDAPSAPFDDATEYTEAYQGRSPDSALGGTPAPAPAAHPKVALEDNTTYGSEFRGLQASPGPDACTRWLRRLSVDGASRAPAAGLQQFRGNTTAMVKRYPHEPFGHRFDGMTTHRACFTVENAQPGVRQQVVWNAPVPARPDDACTAFDSTTEYTSAFKPRQSPKTPRNAGRGTWTPSKHALEGRSEYIDKIGNEHAGLLGVLDGRSRTDSKAHAAAGAHMDSTAPDGSPVPNVGSACTVEARHTGGKAVCTSRLTGGFAPKQQAPPHPQDLKPSEREGHLGPGHLRCPNQWTALVPNPYLARA